MSPSDPGTDDPSGPGDPGTGDPGTGDSNSAAHRAALAWAAASRQRREETVEALVSATTDLAAVLAARADPLVGAIKLVVLVQAAPGVGKVVARRVLASLGLADARAGDIDEQACTRLLGALGLGGPGD